MSKEEDKMIDLVYVGFDKPVKEKFTSVENVENWTKPRKDGGFWTSPMEENGKSAWHNLMEERNHCTIDEFQVWHIIMEPQTRILEADMKLYNLRPYLIKTNRGVMPYVIDYEKMSKDYDFLYVPDKVQRKHCNGVFMGFEVATGLFLNPTFKALNDKEFEAFKQRQQQRKKEDEELLKDPFIQKMLMALKNKEITTDEAETLLMQRIKDGKAK
jgi:hypothetical protein